MIDERMKLCTEMDASIFGRPVQFKSGTSELTEADTALITKTVEALKLYSELGVIIVGYTCGQKKLEHVVDSRLKKVQAELQRMGVYGQPVDIVLNTYKPKKADKFKAESGSVRIWTQQGVDTTPEARLAEVMRSTKITFDESSALLTLEGKAAIYDVFCVLRNSESGCYIDICDSKIEIAQMQGVLVKVELEKLGISNLLEVRTQVPSDVQPAGVTFTIDPSAGLNTREPSPDPSDPGLPTPESSPRDVLEHEVTPSQPCGFLCCTTAREPAVQVE